MLESFKNSGYSTRIPENSTSGLTKLRDVSDFMSLLAVFCTARAPQEAVVLWMISFFGKPRGNETTIALE